MRQGIQILLIISISFFVAPFPVYLHYNYLIGADFSSPDAIFQDLDDEHLLVERQDISVLFTSCDLPNIRGAHFFEKLTHFSFQTSSLNQNTFVYRC